MTAARKAARYVAHANARARRWSDKPGRITAADLLRHLPLTTCAYCAAPADTWDHVVPLARGGHNVVSNLARACHACNRRKGASLTVPQLHAEPMHLPFETSPACA